MTTPTPEETTDNTAAIDIPPAQPVTNRSEIVFLFDAEDCNPNGNPMANNRPRIDPETERCYVTDVCVKQYLRQQLNDDGHGVYILPRRNEEGYRMARRGLVEALLDIESADDVTDATMDQFLDAAVDVRMFGAVMSIQGEDEAAQALRDAFSENMQGPVQFSPAKTLHPVKPNEESDSLTSVVATGEEKEQGGFGLNDFRIKYGLFRQHGIVDESGAADTGLMQSDVARLDTLMWRALTNQPLSRAKFGHQPQFYLRAEFERGYHDGALHKGIELETGARDPQTLRSIIEADHAAVRIDGLCERLARHEDRIERVHVTCDPDLPIQYDGDQSAASAVLVDALAGTVGEDRVDVIDVYDRHTETLPERTPSISTLPSRQELDE